MLIMAPYILHTVLAGTVPSVVGVASDELFPDILETLLRPFIRSVPAVSTNAVSVPSVMRIYDAVLEVFTCATTATGTTGAASSMASGAPGVPRVSLYACCSVWLYGRRVTYSSSLGSNMRT